MPQAVFSATLPVTLFKYMFVTQCYIDAGIGRACRRGESYKNQILETISMPTAVIAIVSHARFPVTFFKYMIGTPTFIEMASDRARAWFSAKASVSADDIDTKLGSIRVSARNFTQLLLG